MRDSVPRRLGGGVGLLVRGQPGSSVTDRVSISAPGEPAPPPMEAKDRPGRAWVALDHSATRPRGLSPSHQATASCPLPRRRCSPGSRSSCGSRTWPGRCFTGGWGGGAGSVTAELADTLRSVSTARLEMSAELLRQKELESAHRPQLLAPEATLRPPDGAEELQRRGAMLVLRHSSAPLLALPPQGPPGPGPPTPPQEPARRAPRKGGPSPASARPSEPKETTGAGLWAQDGSEDEPPKDSDGEDPEMVAAGGQGPTGGASSEGKGLVSGSMLPPPLPLGLPYTVSPYFHTGGHPRHAFRSLHGVEGDRPPSPTQGLREGVHREKDPFPSSVQHF